MAEMRKSRSSFGGEAIGSTVCKPVATDVCYMYV